MVARTYGVTVRRSLPLRLPQHPGSPKPEAWRSWVANSRRPIAIDLFCGAGGLSQGLEAAGYRVALSVDMDEWALETHAHNFPGRALQLDLGLSASRETLAKMFRGITVDLVAGGPPCQPFSRAGKSKIRSLVQDGVRDEVDERRELWQAFVDVVERIRPRAVLMENVPDMALGDGATVIRAIIGRLEEMKYEVDVRIVDTWQYGVPQHRQRLILVGVSNQEKFTWPVVGPCNTLRDAISDLPVLDVSPDAPIGDICLPYEAQPLSAFADKARAGMNGKLSSYVFDHVTRSVRHDDFAAFQMMNHNTLYSDLPAEVKRYRDDIFDDKYNRLGWNELSRSITAHIAKDGYWYIHPDQHRTLTVRESARIQTFPDRFRFSGSRSHQFKQIGNAVPPLLGEAIGKAILRSRRPIALKTPSPLDRRKKLRRALRKWAESDQQIAPWAYPTDRWTALVGIVLGARPGNSWPQPSDALKLAPTLQSATPVVLQALSAMTKAPPRRRALEHLSVLAKELRSVAASSNGESAAENVKIRTADREWWTLLSDPLCGNLVLSGPVLRATARLGDTKVDEQKRHSTGRLELAKLIGGSTDAATLNAALHRLGTQVCTPESPNCGACALSSLCPSSQLSSLKSQKKPSRRRTMVVAEEAEQRTGTRAGFLE